MSLSINPSSALSFASTQSAYQTEKVNFSQAMQAQQNTVSTPGKLNRMLTQDEKNHIRRNFNLANLDHRQAEKLVSYLEQRGVLNPRPQISDEETDPAFMFDTTGARAKPITGYSQEQGVSISLLTPQENDDFFTALTKQVEICHKIIKSSKWVEMETEAEKQREPYQEELLKSLAVIYADAGNASVVANAKAEIERIHALGREEYNNDLRESADLTNKSFPELGGIIPAINELLNQSLKTVSNQWLESKGLTLSEWMTMFDPEK